MKKATASPPLAAGSTERGTVFGICVVLALMVWVVFGQTLQDPFADYDDDVYVAQNQVVQQGLTWMGCRWALTAVVSSNWHPVTLLSHMADCQCYGLNPAGHHFTSVGLHTATVILLFLVLRRLTGSLWRSAFVAAVFAIHPLRVESVAWIAERKDVLCGLFSVLTIGAYARYVQRPSAGRHCIVTGMFALALMSKPMAVTLPFVLLLLDYWPLKRFPSADGSLIPWRLLLEKLPWLVLSGAVCMITVFTQQTAMTMALPLSTRMGNALISYAVYWEQTFYPAGLAIFYPYPDNEPAIWKIIAAAIFLLALTAAAVIVRRKQSWFLTGWLWYLGMLVPVIGLLQVGAQSHADRYTYLPQIGLILAVTWLIAEWSTGWRHRRLVLGLLAAVSLTALLFSARVQAAYWRTNESLWGHALVCTADNPTTRNHIANNFAKAGKMDEAIAQFKRTLQIEPNNALYVNNLGYAFAQEGRLDEAIDQYRKALQISSKYPKIHFNLGLALAQKGDLDGAITQFEATLRIQSDYARAQNNLAYVLAQRGRLDEAIDHYQKALQMDPGYAPLHYSLATALVSKGDLDAAILQFQQALQLKPGYPEADCALANALMQEGRVTEAMVHYQMALKVQPGYLEARYKLGRALLQAGKPDEAITQFQTALQSAPRHAPTHYYLATALFQKGDETEAIVHYETALQLNPDYVEALNDLAWELATAPQAALRDGARALALAQRANQLTGGANWSAVSTLAAAEAEAGQYDDAVQDAQKALELTRTAGLPDQARQLGDQLKLYQARQPYHRANP